jgi:SAM-dependent methyltransferase
MSDETSRGAEFFEDLYRADSDPWNFETSEYEKGKYQATLAALERPSYAMALEVGCSIGVLTARLAPRCRTLHAVDLSPTAIARAKVRCSARDDVRFQVGAAPHDLPSGSFDLILLSEVLYYLSRQDLLGLAVWCRASAASRAEIILCHWLGPTDYPLSGETASNLFVEAMQPCLESHAILHDEIYRLERIRLRP